MKSVEIFNKDHKDSRVDEISHNLNTLINEVDFFRKLKKEEEEILLKLIYDIYSDAEENKKKGIWLLSQKDFKTKLMFSQKFSINNLRALELLPLFDSDFVKSRVSYINDLHKDKVLPVFHYNLKIGKTNIHVIPNHYKNKIKNYLVSA